MSEDKTLTKPTMNAKEFDHAISMIGFSIRGVAGFFGIDERTIYRWKADNHVPRVYAFVLRTMLAKKIDPAEMLEIGGVNGKTREFILANLTNPRTTIKE